ncbi:MAG: exo-alpha-sialidase [Planctomyces sp.]|jgi:predicted neuraminidase
MLFRFFVVLALTLSSGLSTVQAGDTVLYESELIFPPEDFHNHSSGIVETPEGDLITCWFHGKGERTDDTLVISGSRRNHGEKSWSAPFLMADNKGLPDQNCTLFIDADGRLWMFWISAIDNLVRSYFLKYRYSTNYEGDGAPVWTWQDAIFCLPKDAETAFAENLEKRVALLKETKEISETRKAEIFKKLEERKDEFNDKLFQRLGWMPRQPPIMLTDKRMMLGLYSDTFDCSMFAFTEDAGQTWEFSRPLGQSGIQPSVVRRKNGNLVAFMRDSPVVRRAESSDGGMTWKEDPLDILNSGSSVAAVALKNGHWILLVNDLPQGRHVLTAYLSDDEGKTWKKKRALENLQPDMGTGSYPTIIQTKDGSIHATYTHEDKKNFDGKTIKHVRFNEEWILAGP